MVATLPAPAHAGLRQLALGIGAAACVALGTACDSSSKEKPGHRTEASQSLETMEVQLSKNGEPKPAEWSVDRDFSPAANLSEWLDRLPEAQTWRALDALISRKIAVREDGGGVSLLFGTQFKASQDRDGNPTVVIQFEPREIQNPRARWVHLFALRDGKPRTDVPAWGSSPASSSIASDARPEITLGRDLQDSERQAFVTLGRVHASTPEAKAWAQERVAQLMEELKLSNPTATAAELSDFVQALGAEEYRAFRVANPGVVDAPIEVPAERQIEVRRAEALIPPRAELVAYPAAAPAAVPAPRIVQPPLFGEIPRAVPVRPSGR
jgi:hypothetical protein